MPSVITHCWYGDQACQQLEDEALKQCISDNRGVFLLGCQGPDCFFFYHRLPWQKKDLVKETIALGSILHQKHINRTFEYLMDYARKKNDPEITAYVAGFICHWAIDVSCHPYVCYSTGSAITDIGKAHQIFESQIDLGVMAANGLTARDYHSKHLLTVPKGFGQKAYDMLAPLFRKEDGVDVLFRQVNDSIRNFIFVQSLFYDPTNKKYAVIGFLENLFGLKGVGTSMMIPAEYDEELDAMNYRKEKWCHPSDLLDSSNESFLEMAERGRQMAGEVMTMFACYLKDQYDLKEILKYIGDRDFDTARSPRSEMKYFKKDLMI